MTNACGLQSVAAQHSGRRFASPTFRPAECTSVLSQQVAIHAVQQADGAVHASRQHTIVVAADCVRAARRRRGSLNRIARGCTLWQQPGLRKAPDCGAPLTQVTGWCSSSVKRRPMRTSNRRTLPSTLPARISALRQHERAPNEPYYVTSVQPLSPPNNVELIHAPIRHCH